MTLRRPTSLRKIRLKSQSRSRIRLISPSTEDPVEAQTAIAMSGLDGDSEKEIARLNELVRGLQAQAKAQNQKISNLRGQLNRAHDQYKLQTPAQGRG